MNEEQLSASADQTSAQGLDESVDPLQAKLSELVTSAQLACESTKSSEDDA
jgi:hypothetical protein